MQTTIYRTGSMTVPNHGRTVLEYWLPFDERRPTGHASRSASLYASPDILSAHRWLNRGYFKETIANELVFNDITVESDNVRVYRLGHYDRGQTDTDAEQRVRSIDYYWNTSMTLTEWIQGNYKGYSDNWEILLPPSEVITSRVLTYAETRELYLQEDMNDITLNQLDFFWNVSVENFS